MIDVARQADVSLKTVSRFVNGATNIAPPLEARIAEAVALLGYRRNHAAASLRPGQQTRVVGLVIEDVSNPFYSALARAAEEVLRGAGKLLITASSESDGDLHDTLVEELLDRRVDGLLVVPAHRPGPRWHRLAAEVPALVVVDREGGAVVGDAVLADDLGGGGAATRALLAAGSRAPAFVGDHRGTSTLAERYEGYRRALAGAGVVADPAWVAPAGHTAQAAAGAVAGLLAAGAVDAVFTANNRATLGALQAFRAAGRRLPLVGFDDFEAAALCDPPVSTVGVDVAEMGRRAAHLLLTRLDDEALDRRRVVLPTTLTLRGSERPTPP